MKIAKRQDRGWALRGRSIAKIKYVLKVSLLQPSSVQGPNGLHVGPFSLHFDIAFENHFDKVGV